MLDFNDKDNIKYYLRGAKPLFYEREDKFGCTPDNLNNFLQALDDRSQEYVFYYYGTGIAWDNRGVAMIFEAPYPTDENGFSTVNKSDNVRSLSLIRYDGIIPFDLVRENK